MESMESVLPVSGNGGLRILLAEDNAINRKLAEALLHKKNWDVVSVGDGKEVLNTLNKESFDLILMDVQMPEIDGFEATTLIRKKEKETGSHIPIIAMTAHAMKGDKERCIQLGMDDYVSKPMKASDLYGAIDRMVHLDPSEKSISPITQKPDVDLSRAMETVDGDKDLLKELVHQLMEEYPGRLGEIQSTIDQDEPEKLERTAHSFKGAIGNFGAQNAYDLAFELEILGKDQQLVKASEVLVRLKEEMGRIDSYFSTGQWEYDL